MKDRIFPWIRKATGKGRLYYAYVYCNNRPVVTCGHHHRTAETAMRCARKMYRRYLREAASEQVGGN